MEEAVQGYSKSISPVLPAALGSRLQGGHSGMESQNQLTTARPGWCGTMLSGYISS